MKKREKKERRRAERVALENTSLEVYSQKIKRPIEFRAKVLDISSVGAKFVSCRPYSKNTQIQIGLMLPKYGSLIEISGSVVRCQKSGDEVYNVAVEFEEDYYQQSIIDEYIKVMKDWNKSNESVLAIFKDSRQEAIKRV